MPSANRFIERFARLAQINKRKQMMACYLAETALLDCSLVQERPSKIAACCVYAAIAVCNTEKKPVIWTSTLSKHSTYRASDLSQMANDLVIFVTRVAESSFQTIAQKYSTPEFGEVSN
jgi:transcription initiation factor TFIIIB Brf1 subunit/transcription initiation factor TFIIB